EMSRSEKVTAMLRSSFGLLVLATLFSVASFGDQKPTQKEGWLEIHSGHFTVFTDAGEKRGREVALRLEEMRAIFGGVLMRNRLRRTGRLGVVALKSDKDYVRLSPVRGGRPMGEGVFFLGRGGRNLYVLNLFGEDPWGAISHPLAHVLLN